MSRYSASSDLDYMDEPWNRPEPCATTGCENSCDMPATSSWCYECRCRMLTERASENARHQAEVAAEAKRRPKKGAAA